MNQKSAGRERARLRQAHAVYQLSEPRIATAPRPTVGHELSYLFVSVATEQSGPDALPVGRRRLVQLRFGRHSPALEFELGAA